MRSLVLDSKVEMPIKAPKWECTSLVKSKVQGWS